MFLLCCLMIAVSWSHPFGSNLFGHKTEVWLSADRVEVAYLVEVPTPKLLQELRSYMVDIDQPNQADQDRHTSATLQELEDGLRLYVDGERLPWTRMDEPEPSGRGDSRFIAYRLRLEAELPAGARTLNLANGNRPESPALFSTAVFVAPNIVVDESSLIDVDHHGEVEQDRTATWRASENDRELRLSFRVRSALVTSLNENFNRAVGDESASFASARSALSTVEPDVLQSLVKGELTPAAVVLALVLALILGAAHAFAPGHGKALVAAYLLGERRTIRHAFMLGGVVTATHTISVFVLGAVALFLSEVINPDSLLPWMELVSGIFVLGVGIQLVRSRWSSPSAGPDHSHDHSHHHQQHDHSHSHDPHAAAHAAEYVDARTPRDLIALGVSGGIAPCPSAFVLLLTAISFHRVAFGMVLVFVFSLGLAAVVSLVGVTVILMGGRIKQSVQPGLLTVWLPRFSAAVVTLIGVGISAKGVGAVWSLVAS